MTGAAGPAHRDTERDEVLRFLRLPAHATDEQMRERSRLFAGEDADRPAGQGLAALVGAVARDVDTALAAGDMPAAARAARRLDDGDALPRQIAAAAQQAPRRSRGPLVPLLFVLLIAGIVFGVYKMGAPPADEQQPSNAASAPAQAPGPDGQAAPEPAPTLDQKKVDELKKKVEQDPQDKKSWMALGDTYSDATHYMKAIDARTKALELDPTDTDVRLQLGVAQFNAGKVEDAEKNWKQVTQQDPKKAEAYYDLGFLYLSKEPADTAAAEAAWRKVVELEPNSRIAKIAQSHVDRLRDPHAGIPGGVPTGSATGTPAPTASKG